MDSRKEKRVNSMVYGDRGIIKCPKCGKIALYDTDQSDMAIHEAIRGPFILPTEVCYLGFFERMKARKLLKDKINRRN
jgi:hypothetical protein